MSEGAGHYVPPGGQGRPDVDAPVRARLLISGLVQGVCYRADTVYEARDLGLNGWVRNLRDGRVEALVEGRRDRVEALITWCRRGPPAARVREVEVEWQDFRGDLRGFSMDYSY